MSHAAIAAVLAVEKLTTGEKLAALALASYANREHRAWPGNKLAALRAGLSASQYLNARAQLQHRGMIAIEPSGGGRGHATVVVLTCARTGPWAEREVNAERLEQVLSRSHMRGAARLLLAVLAAMSDDQGAVEELSTDDVRMLTGLSDSGYRRARTQLLTAEEISLANAGGGRGRTNRWLLTPSVPEQAVRRVSPPRHDRSSRSHHRRGEPPRDPGTRTRSRWPALTSMTPAGRTVRLEPGFPNETVRS
jgi:hypothetical protein